MPKQLLSQVDQVGLTTTNLKHLEWDSQHFGFPVARLITGNVDEATLGRVLQEASLAGYILIYLSAGADHLLSKDLLACYGGLLVDRRAVFETGELTSRYAHRPETGHDAFHIVLHPRGPASPRIVALGLSAGVDSRFKSDHHIPREKFERLYEIWVQRSTMGELADAVLLAQNHANKPIGLITISVERELGIIGLVAVAKDYCGRGVGTRLVESTHTWLTAKCATRSRVATQLRNVAACRLYSRMGYEIVEVSNVYHFWPHGSGAGSDHP